MLSSLLVNILLAVLPSIIKAWKRRNNKVCNIGNVSLFTDSTIIYTESRYKSPSELLELRSELNKIMRKSSTYKHQK